jgi:hypothetical protein
MIVLFNLVLLVLSFTRAPMWQLVVRIVLPPPVTAGRSRKTPMTRWKDVPATGAWNS